MSSLRCLAATAVLVTPLKKELPANRIVIVQNWLELVAGQRAGS